MPEVFFVFLGGGIGSLLRYFMSKIIGTGIFNSNNREMCFCCPDLTQK